MSEIYNLLKRDGFYKTLELLSIKGSSITLREFYERLLDNKSSYNTFLRIKSKMLLRGLIDIYYDESNRRKKIKLTEKGIFAKQTLKILMELIG